MDKASCMNSCARRFLLRTRNEGSSLTANSCPICNQANHCQIEDAKNCWCMTVTIKPELLNQLQRSIKNNTCICIKCLEKTNLSEN